MKYLQELNPQFNFDEFKLNPIAVLGFCTWTWDRIFLELKILIKTHMSIAINKKLQSSGSNQICSYDEFVLWITSIQGAINVETLWFVLFGTWDNKLITYEFVQKIKTMFGIDLQNYHKHGFILTLLNHALRQIRKKTNNDVNTLCGMTLQKITVNHKVLENNYCNKRKRMQFKEDFKNHRDGNAGKQV